MRKPSDCVNCGYVKAKHNKRDGWCWNGGSGEDATTYERTGIFRTIRAYWRELMYRVRPPFRDVGSFE